MRNEQWIRDEFARTRKMLDDLPVNSEHRAIIWGAHEALAWVLGSATGRATRSVVDLVQDERRRAPAGGPTPA